MTKNKKCEKGTLGWLREQAKKDGFDNIGKWQNWKREQLKYIVGQSSWTKEKIIDIIRRTYDKKKRIPTRADFDSNPNCPSINTIRKLLGGWNNAIIEAGLWNKRDFSKYTDEELLEFLRQFYRENGRPPIREDFNQNPTYPNYRIYDRFGGWQKALKLVGLDVDSMVRKGVIETEDQKARLAEILVRDSFSKESIDLSGENKLSPYDGICPNGKVYDVKSSKVQSLLAFNEDWTELLHAWDSYMEFHRTYRKRRIESWKT